MPPLQITQPDSQKFYDPLRLFIRIVDTAEGAASAWAEQTQNEPGVFEDMADGRSGTEEDCPAFMADGSTAVPDGTICEAVVHHSGQWLIAWPITGGKTDCIALKDECTGATRYLHIENGRAFFSSEVCGPCVPPDDPVTTPCCANTVESRLCMHVGQITNPTSEMLNDFSFDYPNTLRPVEPSDTAYDPSLDGGDFGNRKITLYGGGDVNPDSISWSGSIEILHYWSLPGTVTFIYGVTLSGSVLCNKVTNTFDVTSVSWTRTVAGQIVTWRVVFDEPGLVTCDPFSIVRTGRITRSVGFITEDTGATLDITIGPGACEDCTTYPLITPSTASLAGSSQYITITGTGFSTTPAENIFTFTTLGAVGTCVASTTTSALVRFDVQPQATGDLYATVSNFGCSAQQAQQVATITTPLTGIQIIGLGTNGATFTNYGVTVQAGLLVVTVALYGTGAGTAPVVSYGGVTMTLDASVTDIGSDTVVGMYQYSLPVVAGTGTISIPFAAGPVCQSQAFNILGLTDNLVDKTKTGHGTTAAPPPSTGASASTTAADEGVIASIATINTESVSYTWQNSFSPGGQALYSPFGGARNYMLLDGLRILSATGTVDAAVSVSAPAILAWCAVVVTYK